MDEHLNYARIGLLPRLRVVGLLFFVTLSTAGCAQSDSNTQSTDAAPSISSTVTVDVYSGRPNPSFDLSSADTVAISRELSVVLDADPVDLAPVPSDLGFRGFLLTPNPSGETIVVSPNGVWANGDSYEDGDQSLYLQLRQLAVASDPALADLIPA